jgi:hypothetical protein
MSKITRALGRAFRALVATEPPLAPEGFTAPEPVAEEFEVTDYDLPQDEPLAAEVVARYSRETALETSERKCREYFEVIAKIERERNGWVEMYRVQVSEHLTAQSILERQLISTRQVSARAIVMLNKLRKEQDLEPVQAPKDLDPYDGEPVGLVEQYAEQMLSLLEKMGAPMTDGHSERERIRAGDSK